VCQGFEDVLVDQLLLMYGDVLIVHRSGVSETAAILQGTNTMVQSLPPPGG
jgi:hypothetical protein